MPRVQDRRHSTAENRTARSIVFLPWDRSCSTESSVYSPPAVSGFVLRQRAGSAGGFHVVRRKRRGLAFRAWEALAAAPTYLARPAATLPAEWGHLFALRGKDLGAGDAVRASARWAWRSATDGQDELAPPGHPP